MADADVVVTATIQKGKNLNIQSPRKKLAGRDKKGI
jgi:hypothetical protein